MHKNAEYKVPCRRTVHKMLTDMHDSKMESDNEAAKKSKAIALTSDFWTSIGNESYCGIISHWISEDWNVISDVLRCVYVVERHYSTNIAELYKQSGKDWDISKKSQILVTDMASTVNQTGFAHILCG